MVRMPLKSIKDVLEEYDLELDRIESEIREIAESSESNKLILFQFPDGMKPYATVIVDYFKNLFPEVNFLIWMESCFGACDVPVLGRQLEKKIDLVIQFGHVAWHNKTPIWDV